MDGRLASSPLQGAIRKLTAVVMSTARRKESPSRGVAMMLRRYQHCDPGGLLELLWGSLFKFRWFKLACCAATEKLRVGIWRWSMEFVLSIHVRRNTDVNRLGALEERENA